MSDPSEADHVPWKFGKHWGKTASQIAEIDPGYIVWAWENVAKQNPERVPMTLTLYNDCLADYKRKQVEREQAQDSPRFHNKEK